MKKTEPAPEKKGWTVPHLLETSSAYWSTCTLHAGVKLDLFSLLSAHGMKADEVAAKTDSSPRGAAMLLDALTAMELLEKRGDLYAATPFSAEFLARSSPKYVGHIIMHHHHLVEGWVHLDEAVQTGRPVRQPAAREENGAVRESFLMGMFNLAMQIAPLIVPQINLKGRRRLLDLGGGPGTYAIHFCRNNPELQAVICDLPSTRKFAEETVARFDLSDRITFHEADFDRDQLPKGFDVAWLSHILHGEGAQGAGAVIRKAVSTLNPGGLIMIQEFILDDNKAAPLFPALFSLNMLIGTPEGQSYSQGELDAMLSAAGVIDIKRIPLQLPNGAGVIAGTVPAK